MPWPVVSLVYFFFFVCSAFGKCHRRSQRKRVVKSMQSTSRKAMGNFCLSSIWYNIERSDNALIYSILYNENWLCLMNIYGVSYGMAVQYFFFPVYFVIFCFLVFLEAITGIDSQLRCQINNSLSLHSRSISKRQ